MVIGIWMPLHPGLKLRGEGLVRHLTFLISKAPADCTFEIYLAPWLLNDFEAELSELPPKQQHIFKARSIGKYLSIDTLLFWHLHNIINSIEEKFNFKNVNFFKMIIFLIAFITAYYIKILFEKEFLLASLVLVATLVLTIAYTLKILKYYKSSMFSKHKLNLISRNEFNDSNYIKAKNIKGNLIKIYINKALLVLSETDFDKIPKKIAEKQYIDCWYIINPVYKSNNNLIGKKVTLFADFVYLSCPGQSNDPLLRWKHVNVRKILLRSDAIICLSNHVRDNHLHQIGGEKAVKKSVVIHSPPANLSADAPYTDCFDSGRHKDDESKCIAKNIIIDYLDSFINNHIKSTEIQKFRAAINNKYKIIFCSTQIRPYKNITSLVAAVALARKQYDQKVCLIMTGHVMPGDTISSQIEMLGLEQIVISLPRVPRNVHAALYHCADVTVHPSFYEGGTAAFALWESVSLGTPAILSITDATREDTDLAPMQDYMFDPYNTDQLAAILIDVIKYPHQAWTIERNIMKLKIQKGETWDNTVNKYFQIFTSLGIKDATSDIY